MPGRQKDQSKNRSPGPAAYGIPQPITRTGMDGTAKYSLFARHRELTQFMTPGPGKYQPEASGPSAYYHAPAYSLRARTKGFKKDQVPAPNAYSLPPNWKMSRVRSAPTWSMSARHKVGHFTEDLAKAPGPGTYNSTDASTH